MRTIRLLVVTCLSYFALISTTSAQFTIGDDNGANSATSYPTPIFDYFKTMKSQYLYLASEMTGEGMAAGFITEIRWNVVGVPVGTGTTEDYTIKLLATNTTSLGITSWESGASLVWGPLDYLPTVGTNTFVLDNPFYWNGTSNLIIEICGGDNVADYTKNARVTWSGPLGFNASRTYANDAESSPCEYTGSDYYDATPGGFDYRPRVTFATEAAINCNELPIIGATSSTDLMVCEDELFTLSIGAVAELGIEYAWYSSPNGISWTVIPGADEPSLSTSQSLPTYYRCTVSCSFSGDNSNSIPVLIGINDPSDCYCTPAYLLGTTSGDYVSNVTLGDINNTSGPAIVPYYTYFDALSTDLNEGETYTISITCGEYETDNGIAAWIDFNADGAFSASEKLGEGTGLTSFETVTFDFLVPAGSVPGTTRLRIRDVYDIIGIDACAGYEYGETEDYNVNIIEGVPPLAAFSFAGDPTVTFTDLSTGEPTSWSWNFDDGFTSTLQNPTHTFATNGTYDVCLTATSILGSNTDCNTVTIDSYLPPVADFSYTGDPEVFFTDLSLNDPTSWNWAFGDGFTSPEKNPVHTFAEDGSYYVCLTATNLLGSNTSCEFIEITGHPETPAADFTFSGDPITTFTDISANEPTSWYWDFDDGGFSTDQNPTHEFTSNGTYDVCLTASNAAGENTSCKTVVITSYAAPDAMFSYSGDPTVTFTDLSTNSPESWLWTFDDGDVSTEQNPVHTYATNGTFNVCLSVTAPGGTDNYCLDITIAANQSAPVADFSYEISGLIVEFTDLSTNAPESWYWDFDDGIISGLQNPSHTYSEKDIYEVCLKSTNDAGFTETCKTIDLNTGITLQEIKNINLYPNPAIDFVTVELPENMDNLVAKLYNTTGQQVASDITITSPTSLIINTQSLAAGTYTILVHNSTQFGSISFVKQ